MLEFADVATHTVAKDYLSQLAHVVGLVHPAGLDRAIDCILEARAAHSRVYVMGNGGSATTATHFVCDLAKTATVGSFSAVRAFALVDNAALLTAWANDFDYDRIFAEQVNAHVDVNDVVIGITASGNSRNIIAGFEAARGLGARTIALVGFDGGVVRDLADIVIHVPCDNYGLVEDTHAAIGHAITAAVRTALLAADGTAQRCAP